MKFGLFLIMMFVASFTNRLIRKNLITVANAKGSGFDVMKSLNAKMILFVGFSEMIIRLSPIWKKRASSRLLQYLKCPRIAARELYFFEQYIQVKFGWIVVSIYNGIIRT